MLPYIVITLAVIYFVMKGTGFLEEFSRSRRSPGNGEEQSRQRWFERIPKEADMNRRLEVFKDFLVDEHEDEDA